LVNYTPVQNAVHFLLSNVNNVDRAFHIWAEVQVFPRLFSFRSCLPVSILKLVTRPEFS
jgi:hypothetical protein